MKCYGGGIDSAYTVLYISHLSALVGIFSLRFGALLSLDYFMLLIATILLEIYFNVNKHYKSTYNKYLTVLNHYANCYFQHTKKYSSPPPSIAKATLLKREDKGYVKCFFLSNVNSKKQWMENRSGAVFPMPS